MKQNYLFKLILSICITLGLSSTDVMAQLYPYSSHTFTTCGNIGRFGPDLATVQATYINEPWAANTAYLNMNSQGIQEWTVPVTGTYTIETWGAGSINSTGAKISGDFTLTEGDIVYIAVGQTPSPNVAGGNGGTFVSTGTSLLTSVPLIVSGGGGGYSFFNSPLGDAGFTNDGNNGNTGYGGTSGSGGETNINNTQYGGGGGGGFYSDGVNISSYGLVGQGFTNGAVGGDQSTTFADSDGGFGGGGAGLQYAEPAGGGGYSGGGGGGHNDLSNVEGADRFGGAGGSFNGGVNPINIGGNVGDGQVVITYFCDDLTSTISATTVCEGETVTLSASSAFGGVVTWDNGITNNIPFSPSLGITTYTAVSSLPSDCYLQVDILVNALPTVTASVDNNNFCEGTTQVILTGSGANSYVWDNSATNGLAFDASVGTTQYTVTGTGANMCENTATVDLIVNALPTVVAAVDNDTVCIGDVVVFSGAGATNYTWNNSVINGANYTTTLNGITTYIVTGVDANMCENTATVNLTVNSLPIVTGATDNNNFCEGTTQVVLTGAGADTYTWDNSVIDGVAFDAPAGITTYTVTGMDDNLCENSATVDITVNTLPTVIATVDTAIICLGEDVIFTGSGASTYTWDNSVVDGTPYVPATGTLTYTVTGTDANMCENTASVNVTVNEVIISYTTTDELFGTDGTIELTVSGGIPVYTFDWDNDGTGDFDDLEDLSGLVTGTYNVTVLDSLGCEATETIVLNSQVGIEESVQNLVSIYPNPTDGNISIQTQNVFKYQITSINGTVIANGNGNNTELISLNHVEAGLYFVNITINGLTNTVKVIKN